MLETAPATRGKRLAVFANPSYAAGGQCIGRRLHAQHALDAMLFKLPRERRAEFLMTDGEAPEIGARIRKCGF